MSSTAVVHQSQVKRVAVQFVIHEPLSHDDKLVWIASVEHDQNAWHKSGDTLEKAVLLGLNQAGQLFDYEHFRYKGQHNPMHSSNGFTPSTPVAFTFAVEVAQHDALPIYNVVVEGYDRWYASDDLHKIAREVADDLGGKVLALNVIEPDASPFAIAMEQWLQECDARDDELVAQQEALTRLQQEIRHERAALQAAKTAYLKRKQAS